MRCSEFLEHYSDFRDGVITDEAIERRVIRHLDRCRRCMRYHALLARGVMALRAMSDLDPSPTFRINLKRRLATDTLSAAEPVMPAPASVMASLMLVAAVLLLFWEGGAIADWQRTAAAKPPDNPLPVVLANPGVPFVSFADLTTPAFGTEEEVSEAQDPPARFAFSTTAR